VQGLEQAANAVEGKAVTANIATESLIVTKDNMSDPNVSKYIYKDKC
jgi:ribose transport system substrate-binding protein